MNLAFIAEPSRQWLAGNVTLEALVLALAQLEAARPELSLLTIADTEPGDYASIRPYVEQVLPMPANGRTPPPAPPASLWQRLRRKLRRRLGLVRPAAAPPPPAGGALVELLRQHNIGCLFTGAYREVATPAFPCLTWIYDFQHHALPELFTPQERQWRDALYRRQSEAATLVVVKSEAVRADFAAFAPECAHKVRVLPWVLPVPPEAYTADPGQWVSAYHLPERFFYLPNQFWAHKNHGLVIEALRQLAENGARPVVVCTGALAEARSPQHFSSLAANLSRWGLRDQFIYLGVIPREHVFGLMRQSVAVLNPSRFEGFGLSVAECVSLGKRSLLSDLPVHREHRHAHAAYFDPNDAADLAAKLLALWQTAPSGPDTALEAEARRALPERQRRFAQGFVNLAQEAIDIWAPRSPARPARS